MKSGVCIPVLLTLTLAIVDRGIVIAQPTPIAEIIDVQGRGKVELKREGEAEYRTASVGDDLYKGDLLRVPPGSTGVVRCNFSSRTWTIPDDGVPRGVANTCSPPS